MSNLVAAYLFLGGTGAGAFIVAALMQLAFARKGEKPIPRIGNLFSASLSKAYKAALLLLVLGSICLLIDLRRPDRMLLLFAKPHFTLITFGTFALALTIVAAFLIVVIPLISWGKSATRISTICKVAGVALSLYILFYSGVLLKSFRSAPYWNSWVLPLLFALSSLSAGIAVMALCFASNYETMSLRSFFEKRLAQVDLFFIVAQIVFVIVYVGEMYAGVGTSAFANSLLMGNWMVWFVGGYLGIGIFVPLCFSVIILCDKMLNWVSAAAALATLAGCFSFRFSIVGAGAQFF